MKEKRNFGWIRSRKYIFNKLSIDILIFSIFFSLINYKLIPLISFTFFVSLFLFVNINYVFGKYHEFEISKNKFLINYIFYDFLIIFINLFFNFYLSYFYKVNNILFLKNYLIIILITILTNTILKLIELKLQKKDSKLKTFYFFGSKINYKKVINEIFPNKINYKIIYKNDFSSIYEIEHKFIDGGIYDYSFITESNFDKSILLNKRILSINKWFEIYFQKVPPYFVLPDDIFIINNNLFKYKNQLRLKRSFDIIISFILLVITFPIIIISSILIYFQDFQSPLYKQTRTGINCNIFTIYKLRTMNKYAESKGIQWSSRNDSRVTSFGKLLRKTRIDELPQLINVIKGDMTLIGPRPERPEIDDELKKEINNYNLRYLLKPGLSGWAQVNSNYSASLKESEIKLSYDIFYLKNFSLFLDLLIFFKTIKLVFNAKGSNPN